MPADNVGSSSNAGCGGVGIDGQSRSSMQEEERPGARTVKTCSRAITTGLQAEFASPGLPTCTGA